MRRTTARVGFGRKNMLLPCLLVLPIIPATGCNAPLLPDPAVRYIAFGDSTTASQATTQYWQYVQQDLGLPPEAFAGQGRGGETVAEGLPRLRDLLDTEIYPNAKALLFWQGGSDVLQFIRQNDPWVWQSPAEANYPLQAGLTRTLDEVQAGIEQAIALARQDELQVCVATYYDLQPGECKATLLNVLLPEQTQRANQYVRLLNDRIRLAAANQGATLVDVASQAPQLAADPANYANCNHLSGQGNRLVADLFLQAIRAVPGPETATRTHREPP